VEAFNTGKASSAEDFQSGTLMATVATLLDYIENREEPTPEELTEILEKVKTLGFELRSMLNKITKSIKRNLPHRPGGGRPESLTLDQKREACIKVGTLMGQGLNFREALERVARQLGVSAKTVQRVWQKRAQLQKNLD
jgi:hypothetical protein